MEENLNRRTAKSKAKCQCGLIFCDADWLDARKAGLSRDGGPACGPEGFDRKTRPNWTGKVSVAIGVASVADLKFRAADAAGIAAGTEPLMGGWGSNPAGLTA